METPRTFEVTVGDHQISLELGRCAVALFRTQAEVAYLAVDMGPDEDGEDQTLRAFNNQDFCEWLAGYRIAEQEGVVHRPVVRKDFNGAQMTFREVTGWNPSVVEREAPNDHEIEMWLDVSTSRIDQEWGEM